MEKPVHHIEATTKPRAKPCSRDQGSLPSDSSAAHPTRPGPRVAVTVEVNTLGIHDWNLHVLYDGHTCRIGIAKNSSQR